jgi:hypothetical protein
MYLKDSLREASLDLSPFMAYEFSSITKTKETYCIEKINKGRLEFATIRFPYKEALPGYQTQIFTKHN